MSVDDDRRIHSFTSRHITLQTTAASHVLGDPAPCPIAGCPSTGNSKAHAAECQDRRTFVSCPRPSPHDHPPARRDRSAWAGPAPRGRLLPRDLPQHVGSAAGPALRWPAGLVHGHLLPDHGHGLQCAALGPQPGLPRNEGPVQPQRSLEHCAK